MGDNGMDNFEEFKRIDGFISYEDYLALPQFRNYVAEKNITLPDRISDGKAVAEKAEAAATTVEAKKEKKTNVGAIITAVFALLFTAWVAAGCFIKTDVGAARLFALYDGNSLVELCKKLFGGEYVEAKAVIAAVACLVGVVFTVGFGVIGALCRVNKRGVGVTVIIGTFLAFAFLAASAAIGMADGVATPMGAVVPIAAISFLSAVVSGSGKDGSKEKR